MVGASMDPDDSMGWMVRAACAAAGSDVARLPWTTDADLVSAADVAAMAAACDGCPVRLDCAAYVIASGVVGGFWAGRDRALIVEPDAFLEPSGFLEPDAFLEPGEGRVGSGVVALGEAS